MNLCQDFMGISGDPRDKGATWGKPDFRGTSSGSWCCFLSDLTRLEALDCAETRPFL